jgi:hypothetical protein
LIEFAGKIHIACALFGPFCVKRASGFGLCVAYIVCSIISGQGNLLVGEVGMHTAFAIAFAAIMLCGLTLIFITLRQELKRDLPRQEL